MQLAQSNWNNENLVNTLKGGKVVVMPTDTIYGIVGQALSQSTVLRIYEIKKRAPEKPCIILIGDISELEKFSIFLSEEQKNRFVELSAGGPTSVILDCSADLPPARAGGAQTGKFAYLHRGTNTLAFRLPAQAGLPVLENLRNLLLKTGPLIAPSANPESLPPARNINEAKKYFGNSVDLYMDGGEIVGKASKIIKLKSDGLVSVLRD